MNLLSINTLLAEGKIEQEGLFPHLDRLKSDTFIFTIDFGLAKLPTEPGILLIRGARQYGKSTWLEQQLYHTVKTFGAGSAYYLNGENILNLDKLETEIDTLLAAFSKDAPVRRIFIDEITAIDNWELALKRMADRGKLTNILLITTGSKATDLRRGAERLPGRKGKLARSNYLFTPVSYAEFLRVCGERLKEKSLISYLISGGSPIACKELAQHGTIPEYVIELVRDWIDGEITASGRNRSALFNLMNTIFRFGGSPVGQAKLAREAGLSNNTVANGYIEILNDLGCVTPSFPWDQHRKLLLLRKPCKYHIMNMLAAIAYHPARIRSPDDFLALPNNEQGMWYEWLIAQELMRRNALQGESILAPMAFWQNSHHEIDFVDTSTDNLSRHFIEVKRGRSNPLEFAWFGQQFPQAKLTVVNPRAFETDVVTGIPLEQFLLGI